MRNIYFAIPGDLNTPTGGYRYDRALIAALRNRGNAVVHVPLPAGFPHPSDDDLAVTAATLAAIPQQATLIIDGLAYGALREGVIKRIKARIIALVHHPLALETGTPPQLAQQLEASEKCALQHALHVVVTSDATARTLIDGFGVPQHKVTVATPGLDQVWFSLAREPETPARIVSVGTLTPRKGHDVLIEAMALLRERDLRCDIIGSARGDDNTPQELQSKIRESGLGDRVKIVGTLSEHEIAERYRRASLFALATRYEGFGMVYAEAMAAGLPVIGTLVGAVPGVVGEGAGILVPPDQPRDFADAIAAVLDDPARAASMSGCARLSAKRFGGWDRTAGIVADALERFE